MMSKECISYWIRIFFIAAIITAVLLLANAAHCQPVTTKPQTNSLGVVSYTENPNLYILGNVVEGFDISDGAALNLRIQPLGTYALFTQDILMCGMPLDKFEGKRNPVAITYARRATRMISGIGCHPLLRVDEVQDDKVLPKM